MKTRIVVEQRLPGVTVVRVQVGRKSIRYAVTPLRDGMYDIRRLWGDMGRISRNAQSLRAAIETAVKE